MNHECPTCDQDGFGSERAMKIHHTKVHGETLVETRECEFCGDEFRRRRPSVDQRFCSHECATATARDRVELTCPGCEETFAVHRSAATRRVHCSKGCRQDASTVRKCCAACGKAFIVGKHEADERSHCSEACKYDDFPTRSPPPKRHCEACGRAFRSRDADRFCSRPCYAESLADPRPDDIDDLLYELYVTDDHSHHETWLRANAARGVDTEWLTKDSVRERLQAMGEFDRSNRTRRALEAMDPDELGGDQPDGDDGWKDFYQSRGEADD